MEKQCTRCKLMRPDHYYHKRSNGSKSKMCCECKYNTMLNCDDCRGSFWPFQYYKHLIELHKQL